MRLLLTTDAVGGVWQFAAGLVESLCGEHQVHLVSFGRALNMEQHRWVRNMGATYAEKFQFTASEAALEWMPENAAGFAEGSELLERVAERFQPDLFHTNQFCWGHLRCASWHALRGVPTLVTAHSDVLSWAAACRPGGLDVAPWLLHYRELVQRGLSGTDLLTAPTRWMVDALAENFQLPQRRQVIPNGASLPPYNKPQETSIRMLQAVTAGRLWDEGKNVALLRQVASPMPILIAGEASFGEQHATLPHSAQGLGPLPWHDLLALFRQSAIYVCTSRYEPFGLAPLEAALCGCALLLNDLPSLREVWADAALYFNDADSLSAGLKQLAADPLTLARTAARCANRAAELSLRHTVAAYGALYEELLSSAVCREEAFARAS